ncbi:MAG TPA: hypothetical protein VLV56_06690 [Burkholderiales bacterium]|nr:hypothetical protein [Burkholderiales bacterium]
MRPPVEKRLDRALWYALSVFLAVLVVASFVRIKSFDAFVELKSSALRLEFVNQGREAEMVDFGTGTTIVDGPRNMVGSRLHGISSLSAGASLLLEAQRAKGNRARACLEQGSYILSVRDRRERHTEPKLDVPADEPWCIDVAIGEPFLVRARKIAVEPRVDSRGVETYPDMTGKLRIQDTDKELAFVSGMTLHLLLEERPPTSISFAEGRFGVYAWKEIRVLWSDRHKPAMYYFTPLDMLKKYAGDNGLWYSISLLVGIGFGIRKVLSLR